MAAYAQREDDVNEVQGPSLRRFLKTTLDTLLSLSAVAGLTFILGCEEPVNESELEYNFNKGQGRDNFSKTIPSGIIHSGDYKEVIVDVRSNSLYEIYVRGANDGDSDKVAVLADGNEIGRYRSQVVRKRGDGWWQDQFSPTFEFATASNKVNLAVRIIKTDYYGFWPKEFKVNRVVEVPKEENNDNL